jgi:putative thioredoxin
MSHDVNDFEAEVLQRSRAVPVVVDFWAEWCGPCKVLGPVLERLASGAEGRWVLAKVDTDRHQELAARYGVRGIPNVKLFVNGEVADEFTGALPEAAVSQWLRKALPSPHAARVREAERLLAAGERPAAAQILEEVVTAEPGNHHALVLLAGTLVKEDPLRARALLSPVEEDSLQFQPAEAVRMLARFAEVGRNPALLPDDPVRETYRDAMRLASAEKFDEAVVLFIEVIRTNRSYDDDGARKAVIAIFTLLGPEHPVTVNRRREFSGALYV